MGLSALSVGYGREVGIIMIIYIMAFAYAACSPIILPFALCYFTSAWVRPWLTSNAAYRYHAERKVLRKHNLTLARQSIMPL